MITDGALCHTNKSILEIIARNVTTVHPTFPNPVRNFRSSAFALAVCPKLSSEKILHLISKIVSHAVDSAQIVELLVAAMSRV